MTRDLGWTRAQYASGQSIGAFVMALAGFFIGTQVDRGRARPLMVIGATVFGASLMLTAEITQYWQWVVLRGFTLTLGAALIGNLVVNVILSKWWVERRGRVVGISSMGVSLAGVILPPVMTSVVGRIGWQNGWIVLGLATWVLIYPCAMLMRTTPEESGLNPDNKSDEEMASSRGDRIRADFANSLTRSQALRTPAFYSIVLAFGLSGVGLSTMLQQTIPFSTDSGLDPSTAAWMLTILATPAAFTKPGWGAYMDYVPEKVAAATSFLICTIAMVVILTGAHMHSTWILAVGFFLVGTGIGGQIPIQETIWATYFGRRYLGAVRSVALPFSLLLSAGGPLGVAYLFDLLGSWDVPFIGLGAAWALAAGLVLLVRRPALSGTGVLPSPPLPALSSPVVPPRTPAAMSPSSAPATSTSPEAHRAPRPATAWAAMRPAAPSVAAPQAGDSFGFARPANGAPRSTGFVAALPRSLASRPLPAVDYGLGLPPGVSPEPPGPPDYMHTR